MNGSGIWPASARASVRMLSISARSVSISSIWLASEARSLVDHRRILRERELHLAAHGGERRAQLVRERRAELPHLAHRLLEARERVVERPRDVVELVRDAAHRHAARERADVDGTRRRGHRGQRTQREAGEPPGHEDGRRASRAAGATAAGRGSATSAASMSASEMPTCSRYVRPSPGNLAVRDAQPSESVVHVDRLERRGRTSAPPQASGAGRAAIRPGDSTTSRPLSRVVDLVVARRVVNERGLLVVARRRTGRRPCRRLRAGSRGAHWSAPSAAGRRRPRASVRAWCRRSR